MFSLTIDTLKGGVISDFLTVTLRVCNFVSNDIFLLFYRYEKLYSSVSSQTYSGHLICYCRNFVVALTLCKVMTILFIWIFWFSFDLQDI